MKKIFFLITVFIFSTAFFFKSDLEECTDTNEYTVAAFDKNFIKQSLKKKMRVSTYAYLYENCVNEKKRNPEVFKAKYD